MWLLAAVAAVLGLVSGVAAVALFKLIGFITHLTLLHDVGTSLPSLRHYHPSPWIVVTAVAGAVIVSLLALWAPVIRGHGIPESLEAILTRDSRIQPRAAVAKPLSAAVTIGTGGPFGAEGPIIVTGGSIGSLIGQALSVSPIERRIMLATGAAAGMSATFNAPVASVLLAVELVLFERSLRTIVPLCIACGIAAAVHVVAFGSDPLFLMPADLHVGLAHLPLFAVVGVVSGLLAVVLNKGLFAIEAGFRRLPVNIFWWPCIGALGFALIGLLQPRTLSMGYAAITDTLNGRFTVTALAILLVAKLFSWWIALGSQTSGGTLAPMFLIGAITGGLFGQGIDHLFPGLHVSPAAFALVAMGATFGASTRAVFASVVFAVEVTGTYHMIVPLMIGVAAAELVAEMFLTDRLMTEKLSHRGLRVDFRTDVDGLRLRLAHQIMDEPRTMESATSVEDAATVLDAAADHPLAVVGPDGAYAGLVFARDVHSAADDGSATTVAGVARTNIEPLRPHQALSSVLETLMTHDVPALPVVEGGRVLGYLTRSGVAAERHRHTQAMEARQPGWARARTRQHNDPMHGRSRKRAGLGPVSHLRPRTGADDGNSRAMSGDD